MLIGLHSYRTQPAGDVTSHIRIGIIHAVLDNRIALRVITQQHAQDDNTNPRIGIVGGNFELCRDIASAQISRLIPGNS